MAYESSTTTGRITSQFEIPEKLKILHVIWWGDVGGIVLNLVDLVRHSAALDQTIGVCVLARSSPLVDSLRSQGVSVRALGARSGADISAFLRLARFVRDNEFDVIHDHTGNILAAAAIAYGAPNALKIHQEHGAINIPRLRRRKRFFYKWCSRLYDRLIAVSTRIADDMVREGADKGRIVVVENAVDPIRFSSELPRGDAKQMLRLPETALAVGTACRFLDEKDLDLFLRVARAINDVRKEVVFVMVGDGPEFVTLQQQASKYGVRDSVVFTGIREDMPVVWRALDVYLFTSRDESFGRTLLESLASETPIVAALPLTGGAIDLVRETPGIVGAGSRDAQHLAALTIELLDSASLRTETGRIGRQWVADKYHVTNWVKKLDELYRTARALRRSST